MNWKALIVTALLGYGAYHHYLNRPVIHGPGEIAPSEPMQNKSLMPVFQLGDFTITPLADYAIEARVLSKENYSLGTEAEISPTDLAVGWGPMSDESVLNQIVISQGNRFFYWHVDEFPIPQHAIEIHAANMHIIPANEGIKRQLDHVRAGQLVTIKGQLVEAKKANGWHWRSSLSRDDTGSGACELMYVTGFSAK